MKSRKTDIPQGLALGATIVFININDPTKTVCDSCYLFADDVTSAGAGLERISTSQSLGASVGPSIEHGQVFETLLCERTDRE